MFQSLENLQARIKRLMQSDEDIGKVAQATPVVVAKALELFMTSLIQESCNQARCRNAKRVSPSHLKQAVKSIEHFDFLIETVEKYPDPVGAPVEPLHQQAAFPSSSNDSSRKASTTDVPGETSDNNDVPHNDGEDEDEEEEDVDTSMDYTPAAGNTKSSGTTTRSRTRARS